MPRLFVTERELNFISDISKEIVKDIIGQKIFYYAISESKTYSGFYGESHEKVWDHPIEIDAFVDAETGAEVSIGKTSADITYVRKVFVQYRDLLEKGIKLSIGDFFSFGENFYEISSVTMPKHMFGFADRQISVEISGIKARSGLFAAPLQGPVDEKYTTTSAKQTQFIQSRGENVDASGRATGDKRDLVDRGVLSKPLTSPASISSDGDPDGVGNAFYGDA